MWYGKMTQELEQLYNDYYKMFGRTPDGYMELEYGESSYKVYVKDIKKSLKLKKELPDFVEQTPLIIMIGGIFVLIFKKGRGKRT